MRANLVSAVSLLVALVGCDKLFSVAHVDPPAVVDADAQVDAAADAVLLVQQKAIAGNAATLSVMLDTAPTKGNTLIVVGANTAAVIAAGGIVGGGAAWKDAVQVSGSQNIEIWYGVSDGSSQRITMSSSASGETWMLVAEWSGLSTISPYELGTEASGTAGTASAGSLTPVDAPTLWIFGITSRGAISADVMDSAAGTWTQLMSTDAGQIGQFAWYQLVGDTTTHKPQAATTGSWDAALATFRAAQ